MYQQPLEEYHDETNPCTNATLVFLVFLTLKCGIMWNHIEPYWCGEACLEHVPQMPNNGRCLLSHFTERLSQRIMLHVEGCAFNALQWNSCFILNGIFVNDHVFYLTGNVLLPMRLLVAD